MLRESEYARAYKSPEHLSSQQAAGLRSVDVAPTEEPSFSHKKKTQDHAKRVSFGSGVVEECTPFEQDAALRFRAGVKRPPIPRMTTEYQAHFTWKQPTPPPTPPSPSHRTEQEHSTDRKMEVGGGGGGRGGKHTTEATPIDHELIQSSTRNDRSEEDRGRHWQDPRGTEGVAASGRPVPRPTLSAKEKCSSKKGCHGKRKRVVRSSPLTTEYRSQFKAPSQVSKEHPETSTDSHAGTVPQGRPDPKASVEQLEREREEEREEEREARERDEREEERERTSPQRDSLWSPQRGSLWSPQRGTVWSSEYDANFVEPSTLTYRKGAWIGAPHPDLYAPSPPRASSDARHTGSWFDQVVELHQEAEAYKMRQLSDHMNQSVEECGSQGDAASDSTCSSCSSASGGDSNVHPSRTSNRIAAHGQEEVRVEDIEEGGEEEVRGRSGEEEEEREDGTIHGSHPKRRGQKKTFLSGETAQKSHAYDLRVPRPSRRNLNAQLGGDGRDGWTPTPEVQANRRMNRHGDAIVTSDGPSHPLHSPPPSPFHPPHSPPPSPPLSPPPSPSQPTSVTRDEGSNSIPNRTTLTEPRSQATQPPPVPGTSPPRPPHLRSETRHQLPEPSSMAFSVPLSPERSQTDGAQWRAFVRKRNKEQLESHAPSSGKPRRVAPPSGKAAPPSGKVAPPSGRVAPPSGKVAPPSGRVAPPSGKVAPPASEMVPPTRKVSTFPPASHKNTEGTTGHSRRLVSTDVRDTRSTIGKENPHHTGASGGLGTCSTCGAYLFPSRLGRDEEAPPPGKLHSAGSSCRLCSKVQSQVTGHLGSSHTDKPLTIHGLHQTEARRFSVPVPESGAHEASPAKHTRGLERHSSELSLSSLSSCSVASDVLARARERKDFWSSAAPPATE